MRGESETICQLASRAVRVDEFAADVAHVATLLPKATTLVNLASERYQFTVLLFAAAVAGKETLLPGNREAASVAALTQAHPDCVAVHTDSNARDGEAIYWDLAGNGRSDTPTIDPEAGVTVFTSGSTGQASAHRKSWRLLDSFRQLHAGILNVEASHTLVATVPSWHMYGFEWALLLPTVAPLALYCGSTFYPGDLIKLLQQFAPNTILVSTPVHLRALLATPSRKISVAKTVCATAPIDQNFATEIEARLNCELLEIYGCSEIGSLASRRTVQNNLWRFFDAFSLQQNSQTLTVSHPLLAQPVALADIFSKHSSGYRLDGRATDIVKVGGKRDSLARLNMLLQQIDGVDDGVFYRSGDVGLQDTDRLSAVAVTKTLTSQQIRRQLAADVEPAFLPRPITLVDELPRNATGKLQAQELSDLIHRHRGKQ